jgi:linoleoyl-CoA desaturase
MAKVTFNNSNNLFFQSLKKSVDNYFKVNGLKKTGNWQLYTKTLILIPAALSIYISLLMFQLPVVLSLLLCAVLGLLLASIGFNVMHDACHGSYSSRPWVNKVLGLTLNALGGNAFFWKQKHNIMHHTYTNIQGADDDIAQSKYLRQSPTQPWIPIHRYQHIYLTLAYSLMLFMWVGVSDFKRYFTRRIHNTPLPPMNKKEHLTFWTSKVLYLVFYILIPILIVGPIAWIIGYLIMGITTGIALAYVFQLAHAVEGPEFNFVSSDDKTIEMEWAIHQIKTTANFAPHNKFVTWLVGGLNFQVEHHLFPRISHVHYPALSKIVEQHCRLYQLPYHCFPNLAMAVASHVRTMKQLGQNTKAN